MEIEALKKIIEREGNCKIWKYKDLICMIYRFRQYGNWCGYVGVDKNNMLYGKDYNQEITVSKELLEREVDTKNINIISLVCSDNKNIDKNKISIDLAFDVHGGITFADKHRIYELDDRWFFGFDTAHAGDLALYHLEYKLSFEQNNVYRDRDYVVDQTNSLAKQIHLFNKNN